MSENFIFIAIIAVLWTLPWKGIALWKAAQAKNRLWFIALLIVNSLAILEILYIFIFSRKKSSAQPTIEKNPTRTIKII